MKKLVLGAIVLAALAVVPAAADASVTVNGAAKCDTNVGFPSVRMIRTVNVPAYQSQWRIPRWLVACSGANWLKASTHNGRFPSQVTLHGASWTVGTWSVRSRFVATRDSGYMHFVLSKGRQRLVFNGFS